MRARGFRVAVIIDIASPYDRRVIRGIGAYAREVGTWSLYVEEEPAHKFPDSRAWRGQGIIANFDDPRVAAAVRAYALPVVGIGGGVGWHDPAPPIPYFVTDAEAIARLAAEHLVQRGFRRLAYCGQPATRTNAWSRLRGKAFVTWARRAGLPCWHFTGRCRTPRRWASLQAELSGWLDRLPKPVGLMACDDARARHVLEACRTLGVRVPEDVAIIGVDNDETICELTDPPLSSVDQGAQRLGYHAAAALDRIMRGKRVAPGRHYLAPERIVTRGSTDVLAIENPDLAMAARFIRDHACENIRVADVVNTTGLSRSTLERQYGRFFGHTVRAAIQRTKLQRAQQLLATTDLRLKQIARQAGFAALPHFSRLFRRQLGQTPSQYRSESRLGRVGLVPCQAEPCGARR